MVWLRAACLGHLASMPTSLAQDEALLERLTSHTPVVDASTSPTDAPPQQAAASGSGVGKYGSFSPQGEAEAQGKLWSPHALLALQWRACQKR